MPGDSSCYMGTERNPDKIFADYEYGRFNLLDDKFGITEVDGVVIFSNFFSPNSQRGTCDEVAEHFYQNSEKGFYRATGNEPLFFCEKGRTVNHDYLLQLQDTLPDDYWELSTGRKVDIMLEQDPLIYDPSFKKVVRFSDSGYTLKNVINEPYDKRKNMLLCRTKEEVVSDPLGFSKDNQLAELTMFKDILAVTLRRSSNEYMAGELLENKKKLMTFFKNDGELQDIVSRLSDKYVSRNVISLDK